MRLIPPTIAESTQSDGERVVFEALAASDASSWTVLHSFDVAEHRRRLAGEIDFLCLVPGKGVLVVEVKGCHALRRQGGDWYYGTSTEPDHRGPFRQASEAMHSVHRRLAKRHPELAGVPFWSAVCFPFIEFRESRRSGTAGRSSTAVRCRAAHRAAHRERARQRPPAPAWSAGSAGTDPERRRADAGPVRCSGGRCCARTSSSSRAPSRATCASRRRCATTPRSSSRRWTPST